MAIGSNMSKTTSFNLGSHFSEFIQSKLESGRYGSASEVVRAGLRLLEQQENHVEQVRQALIKGEQSGTPKPFDVEAFLKKSQNRLGQ